MFDIEKEQVIWKPYPEYPFIEANKFGEIRTKERYVPSKNGSKRLVKGHVLKQHLQKNGYKYVNFSVNSKIVALLVHRIVAICFLPNPDNLPEVNHIDNDRTNNAVSNLEWCTSQYNQDYRSNFGTSAAELFGLPVIAVNLDSFKVLCFKTRSEAARQLGIYQTHICAVVRGQRHTAGGWWFTNANESAVEKTRAKFGDDMANKVEELMTNLSIDGEYLAEAKEKSEVKK